MPLFVILRERAESLNAFFHFAVAVACHSAWSKAQAQNPSMPFTILPLP
jgi:hypothetical protein